MADENCSSSSQPDQAGAVPVDKPASATTTTTNQNGAPAVNHAPKQKPTQTARQQSYKESTTYQEREERARLLREKQSEERQKKLEELRQQAIAAQKFRDQQEEERRRRILEMKQRDEERRLQVEERKRQIMVADRERKSSLLLRNQERDLRMEAKRRNERSQIVFAFGSCTPRMLDPREVESSTGFSNRRATSTTNIGPQPQIVSRRSSEREVERDKKRATSAHSLDRKQGEDVMSQSLNFGPPTRGRRRTDLMPTLPSQRDRDFGGSRPRHKSPGLRSGTATPSSPSRPLSAMSQNSVSSQSSSVSLRLRPSRRPRPISIAVTGVTGHPPPPTADDKRMREGRSLSKKPTAPPVKQPRARSVGPQQEANKPVKKTPAQVKAADAAKKADKEKMPKPKIAPKPQHLESNKKAAAKPNELVPTAAKVIQKVEQSPEPTAPELLPSPPATEEQPCKDDSASPPQKSPEPEEQRSSSEENQDSVSGDSSSKPRITTVEEAKAAIAEKRRLAREQAEREAEEARQREEDERLREEEEQRKLEEETLRLAEEARKQEEERLQKAIEEAKRRDEEEKKKKEEEAIMKAQKEEEERKAKEETERQMKERQERLEKEEEERKERRKRVEAIMSRTRGKKDDKTQEMSSPSDENKSSISPTPSDDMKKDSSDESTSESQTSLKGVGDTGALLLDFGEVKHADAQQPDLLGDIVDKMGHLTVQPDANANTGGSDSGIGNNAVDTSDLIGLQSITDQHSGHQNGMDNSPVEGDVDNLTKQNNETNNLLDLSDTRKQPGQLVSSGEEFEQIMTLPQSNKLVNEDNVNFNVTNNRPAAPFFAFEDNNIIKQDTTNTDLLS